jgi:flap endonuclease-1
MGIKDLNKFITIFAPEAIKKVEISKYKGQVLAVDTSIFLYKFKYSNKLLDSFLQQYVHFKKEGVELIYIFDGPPPKEKEFILASRKIAKEKQTNKIQDLELKLSELELDNTEDNIANIDNIEEIKSLDKQIKEAKRRYINITKEDISNVKRLFDIIGAKYIVAKCEADLVCCDLYKRGVVQGCISNDMDFLPSGTGILIRNYNLGNMVDEYNLEKVLELTYLTYDKFVDFCILCGCDYTCKINRLGFITAYKSLKKYENIEEIIENLCVKEEKFKLPSNFNYEIARKLLKNEENKLEEYEIMNETFIINEEEKVNNIKFILQNTRYSSLQLNNRLKIIFSNIK